jgi:hypothetical protein
VAAEKASPMKKTPKTEKTSASTPESPSASAPRTRANMIAAETKKTADVELRNAAGNNAAETIPLTLNVATPLLAAIPAYSAKHKPATTAARTANALGGAYHTKRTKAGAKTAAVMILVMRRRKILLTRGRPAFQNAGPGSGNLLPRKPVSALPRLKVQDGL